MGRDGVGHGSGDGDGLDRDVGDAFGSEGYAREELRAEIASLILGSEVGLGYEPGLHAGYVDSWVKILRETPQEILYAAAAAEKISEYIRGLEHKREINQTQEVTAVREQIPYVERTYLAGPYDGREEAKAIRGERESVEKEWN